MLVQTAPYAFGINATPLTPVRPVNVRRMDTPSVTAMIVEWERDFRAAGEWYCEEAHFFDMSLTTRPSATRGFFEGVSTEPVPVGKLCFVPAGYRLRGESPEYHQRNLRVFVRAHALLPANEDFGADWGAALRECTRLNGHNIHETLERIEREVNEPGFASELLVEGLGLSLVAETARALRVQGMHHGRKGGLPAWRLKAIEERIRSDRLPTVGELAQLSGLSIRQLARAFREETGRTVSAYLREHMVERAKALLAETASPIAVIAHDVGFTNVSAFSSAFRRTTGESPRNYRGARQGLRC